MHGTHLKTRLISETIMSKPVGSYQTEYDHAMDANSQFTGFVTAWEQASEASGSTSVSDSMLRGKGLASTQQMVSELMDRRYHMGHKLESIVHLPTPSFARPAGHVSCDLSPATVKGQAKGKAKGTETTAGFTLRVTEFNRVGNTNVGRIRKFLATEGCPEPSEITFVGRASRSKMPMWCSVPKFSTLPGKPAFGTDCIQRKSRSQRLCSGMGLAF